MGAKGRALIFVSVICCFILPWVSSRSDTDTLLQGQQLRDGQNLVSAFGPFSLGFVIHPSQFRQRYLGISYYIRKWQENPFYNSEEGKVVWVANRNTPIFDNSGVLTIDVDDCNLKILHNGGDPIGFTSIKGVSNASATLLENGNFVLRETRADGSTGRVLWQSFDYPTDTLLPGMKLGVDLRTGHKWSLRSSRDEDTLAEGSYSLGLDTNGTKQLIMWWLGDVFWTSGTWLNGRFNFSPELSPEGGRYNFSYISNENESYFHYSVNEDVTPFPFLTIDYYGRLISKSRNHGSEFFQFGCSAYLADREMPLGCVRKESPICRNSYSYFDPKYGFMSGVGFKFSTGENLTLSDCYNKCYFNCSCIAFASTNKDGTGCEIWTNQTTFQGSKTNDARQIHMIKDNKSWTMTWWFWVWLFRMLVTYWVVFALPAGVLLYCSCIIWRKLKEKGEKRKERKFVRELQGQVSVGSTSGEDNKEHEKDENNAQGHELELFSFDTIAFASNNFSAENKLGEGGFGPVYKGQLPTGQKIAIKRLKKSSGQGLIEFKNEAVLIARLQHTNLVRLLGCCVQLEERILIYEYLPNKSLDFFLFGSHKRNLLNWKNRLHIIEGIAQGLVYLHKYSRLKIIHRDLKASNILLDDQMNPKISDFGMAKTLHLNQSETNTSRIVGTRGYMPPEYARDGFISTKIDVYSFGVLLLEIISGKKNNGRYHPEHPLNLAGYAWQLWNEGRGLELLDPKLEEPCSPNEVLRCINVGLLCVQDCATDRPNMSDVVSMLTNETTLVPKKPAFYYIDEEPEIREIELENFSRNEVTISVMEAR